MSEETAEKATLNLDGESKRKLAVLAKAADRSMSAQVRWLINQEYDRQFPETTPPPSLNK